MIKVNAMLAMLETLGTRVGPDHSSHPREWFLGARLSLLAVLLNCKMLTRRRKNRSRPPTENLIRCADHCGKMPCDSGVQSISTDRFYLVRPP